ncbi:MAG: response regulator transcription factor [Lactobacillus sp.]|nr:response regulator transcription factor [Lactobacillus sp.]
MRILLVEDDQTLSQSLTKLLKKQNYSIDTAFDGIEALEYVQAFDYDLIILDVMMPRLDGFGFVEKLRAKGNEVAVLMLTAKDSLADRVKGLDLGADDYLVKPFEFDELLARIRAMLRRKERSVLSDTLVLGDVTLNFAKKKVTKNGILLELTAKEYAVLEYLARNRGHIKTQEQIRAHVWDFDYEGESNIIAVLVKNIRKKTGVSDLIKTKRGIGYVVEA